MHAIATALSAPGLNVHAGTGGVPTLYVVHHGGYVSDTPNADRKIEFYFDVAE